MSHWHYLDNQRQAIGPFEAAQIAEMVRIGQLDGNTQVWYPGWPNWAPLSLAWQSMGLPTQPATLGSSPLPRGHTGAVPLLAPGQNPWSLAGFANKVTDLVGLERIEGFSMREMMGSVFKRYGDESIEAYFSVGLKETTPPLEQVTTKWPQPWMFARALLLAVILYLGFRLGVGLFNSPFVIPAVIITGSFAVPMATVIFFFEMNAPQNVSLYQVLKLILLGGVVSILLSLLLFDVSTLDDFLGPPSAGVIEELGKLATVLLLTRKMDPQRYPYITNGMLFGAAVGAGFAAFESAGYAFVAMMEDQSFGAANDSIMLRGLLAPFGHVAWTALTAGGVWAVRGAAPFKFAHLFQKRAVSMLFAAMTLHFVWNLPFAGPFWIKYWLLGFVAWVLVLALLQTALKQVRSARNVSHTMARGLSLAEVQDALRAKLNGPGNAP